MATATPRPDNGVTWARVEDGFHVGSRHGEFLGYVDRQSDGGYLAFDAFSRMVGRFRGITAAMSAVADAPGAAAAAPTHRSPHAEPDRPASAEPHRMPHDERRSLGKATP